MSVELELGEIYLGKDKAWKRYLYNQFDFDFDFSFVSKEQSVANIMKAIHLGTPFYSTCYYLNFSGEIIEDLVKEYVLFSVCEEARQLNPRQIELMEQYSDQTVLGVSFSEYLSDLMYFDPQQWSQTFENAIVYLVDAGYGEAGLISSSTLSVKDREQVTNRLFGDLPYLFDDLDGEDYKPIEYLRNEWYAQGNKSGAAYRFFKKFLTQEQFLRPHPNDVLANNRKTRMVEQYAHFKTILKDILPIQDITEDLQQYEGELHTGFLYYASSKIEESNIYCDPTDKRKADTITKITAMLTLIRSPELRICLFHTILNEQPFNFKEDREADWNAEQDWKLQLEMNDLIKEGQIALYMSIICTVESALKIFIKDKVSEMISYFVPIQLEPLSDEEEGDAVELVQLKKQLAVYALLKDCCRYSKETIDTVEMFQPGRFVDVSDDIFSSLYQWIYRVNKEYSAGKLFRSSWWKWLRQNYYLNATPLEDVINKYRVFAEQFEQFARINLEDLGCKDVEKLLKKID